MEKLWTTAEVAHYLGIDEGDVEQLVRDGKLTGYKLGGKFLRFAPSQIESLKGTVRVQPTAAQPALHRTGSGVHSLQEFLYFYDFYVISAALLAVLVIYLVAAG